ncbi:hypothetical protein [Desulfovibrio inopinatus]|uniref:hypothetical protein n=1 Tax=Desulfovibrio inopinatus TaxID=102109 RepID=UPI0004295172|nr:hypothetical protein [Desulfovibrio inopinatus]
MEEPLFHITGRVERDCGFTLSQLQAMDMVETDAMLLACGDGQPLGAIQGVRGVLLADIINETKVINKEHNDTKKMYIVVRAEDEYRVVFSWQEVFNTVVGEGVIVILERGGEPVYTNTGKVDLFSAQDTLTGPRYVKSLSTVTICILDEDAP